MKSVTEMRQELQEKLDNLSFYQDVESYFNSIITSCDNDIEYFSTISYKNGKESEQATNWEGELLWCLSEDDRYGKTKDSFSEDEQKNLIPYYNDKYSRRERTPDEYDEWDLRRLSAAKQVKSYIEKLDIFKTFKYPS